MFLIESDRLKLYTIVERFVSSVNHPTIDARVMIDDTKGETVQLLKCIGKSIYSDRWRGISEDGKNRYPLQQKRPDEPSEKIDLLDTNVDFRQELSIQALETADGLDRQHYSETYAQVIHSAGTSNMRERPGDPE